MISVVMEGVITRMKGKDRKLIDSHLALAVDKDLDLVFNDHFWKVMFFILIDLYCRILSPSR